MASNISISEATESDLPEMVAICCDGMEEDILTRFLYGHQRTVAVRKQTDSLMGSLGKRFTHPTNKCHIFKAVDTQNGELVGWILVRWETPPTMPPDSGSDKRDFVTHYQHEVKRNWFKLLAEKSHVGKMEALTCRLPQLKDAWSSTRSPVRKNRSAKEWNWKTTCRIHLFEV